MSASALAHYALAAAALEQAREVSAESIDFFHMDALSSAVPLKIDADLQFTLIASSLYRPLGRPLHPAREKARTADAGRVAEISSAGLT